MDAITSDPALSYFSSAPVLIAGSSELSLARARRTVDAFGLRVGDAVPIGEAADRLNRQAAASAVWIELDGSADRTNCRDACRRQPRLRRRALRGSRLGDGAAGRPAVRRAQ